MKGLIYQDNSIEKTSLDTLYHADVIITPSALFRLMHLQNKFYPLAPNQESNCLSAIFEKYYRRVMHSMNIYGAPARPYVACKGLRVWKVWICGGSKYWAGPSFRTYTREKETHSSGIVSGWDWLREQGSKKTRSIFTVAHGTLTGQRANKPRTVMGPEQLAEHWKTTKSPLSSNHAENKSHNSHQDPQGPVQFCLWLPVQKSWAMPWLV